MERTGATVALDKGNDFLLWSGLAECAVAIATANESLVGFDNLAASTKGRFANGLHGFAQAVAHEPRGFVGDAEHTVDLMR
jgi:hypothetical protein